MKKPWNVPVARKISAALARQDLDTACKLLRKHPENLMDDGNDAWLGSVASRGWLKAVKALVDLGIDVNASANIGEGTRFHQPEGPILLATINGHVSVVKWLLENGARINFVIKGKPRCGTLWTAIRHGHFTIVKLLVEHGADLDAVSVDGNATTLADYCGQNRIRDYLVSNGGVDLRDGTSPDLAAAHKLIDQEFASRSGAKPKTLFLMEEFDPEIRIQRVESKAKGITIYTRGLSDRELPTAKRKHACSELVVSLPSQASGEIQDWASEELTRLAAARVSKGKWFSRQVVAARHTPDKLPFRHWLIHLWDEGVAPPDHRVINFHELIPLFENEARKLSNRAVGGKVRGQISELRPNFFAPRRPKLRIRK